MSEPSRKTPLIKASWFITVLVYPLLCLSLYFEPKRYPGPVWELLSVVAPTLLVMFVFVAAAHDQKLRKKELWRAELSVEWASLLLLLVMIVPFIVACFYWNFGTMTGRECLDLSFREFFHQSPSMSYLPRWAVRSTEWFLAWASKALTEVATIILICQIGYRLTHWIKKQKRLYSRFWKKTKVGKFVQTQRLPE